MRCHGTAHAGILQPAWHQRDPIHVLPPTKGYLVHRASSSDSADSPAAPEAPAAPASGSGLSLTPVSSSGLSLTPVSSSGTPAAPASAAKSAAAKAPAPSAAKVGRLMPLSWSEHSAGVQATACAVCRHPSCNFVGCSTCVSHQEEDVQ